MIFRLLPLLLLLVGCAGQPQPGPAPAPPVPPQPSMPDWTAWPAQDQRDSGSGTYADVINHSRGRPFARGDRVTRAHETAHGIHSEIRNSLLRGKRGNAFYLGHDRAVLVGEPNFKLADLIPHVPQKLRGSRFRLYLQQQQRDWNSTPTYVFDEGVAYLLGARVAIEEAQPNARGGRTDVVHACAEFAVYATAFALAAEQHDPGYLATGSQGRRWVAWFLRQSLSTYQQGQRFPQFEWDNAYVDALRSGPAGAPLRACWQRLGLEPESLFPEVP